MKKTFLDAKEVKRKNRLAFKELRRLQSSRPEYVGIRVMPQQQFYSPDVFISNQGNEPFYIMAEKGRFKLGR